LAKHGTPSKLNKCFGPTPPINAGPVGRSFAHPESLTH
jgi:hypothetical protein